MLTGPDRVEAGGLGDLRGRDDSLGRCRRAHVDGEQAELHRRAPQCAICQNVRSSREMSGPIGA